MATDTYSRRIADVSGPLPAGADAATVRLPLDLALAQWVRAELRRQREVGFNIWLSWADSASMTASAAALGDMQLFVFTTGITKVSDGEAGLATNPEFMRS